MKADIEFLNPFNIKLSIVEIEDTRLGSFRTNGIADFKFITGNIQYSCESLWFTYEQVDQFMNDLKGLANGASEKQAMLSDMSNEFIYSIDSDQITLNIYRQVEVIKQANLALKIDSDLELIATNYNAIKEFPKWW